MHVKYRRGQDYDKMLIRRPRILTTQPPSALPNHVGRIVRFSIHFDYESTVYLLHEYLDANVGPLLHSIWGATSWANRSWALARLLLPGP